MRLSYISFQPTIDVILTEEEIQVCIQCAKNHYDARCKATVGTKEKPGLLDRMLTIASNSSLIDTQRLTWSEVDTLAKVVEVGLHLPDREVAKKAYGLGMAFHRALNEMRGALPQPIALGIDVPLPAKKPVAN